MRAPFRPLVFVAAAFVALLWLAPQPASAIEPCVEKCIELPCPCWGFFPVSPPLICFDNQLDGNASPVVNTFAYFGPTVFNFYQVTNFWCRVGPFLRWINPAERDACRNQILEACGYVDDPIACMGD